MSPISHLLFNVKLGHVQINICHHMKQTSASMLFPSAVTSMTLWNWFFEDFAKINEIRQAKCTWTIALPFWLISLPFWCHEKVLHFTKICKKQILPCWLYVQLQKLVNVNNNNCNCKKCKCKKSFWLLHACFASCFSDITYDANDEQVNKSMCNVAPTCFSIML